MPKPEISVQDGNNNVAADFILRSRVSVLCRGPYESGLERRQEIRGILDPVNSGMVHC